MCTIIPAMGQNNVAYQDGQVRFSVITDRVIRLEWNKEGKFVDAPSFVAVDRQYPKVNYRVKDGKHTVEITTDELKLTYKKGEGKLTDRNLSIVSAKSVKPAFAWKPGMKQTGNLGGTFRTLDRMDGDLERNGNETKKITIPDGLIATDGWTLIDDSRNFLFDNSEWPWVEARTDKGSQDWYFMGYGHDYKAALKDFTVFSGKIPLPPRYAFGYWWSRYWAYSDDELRTLVNNFHTYNIPLDVLVIDMDWHYTEPGKGGWTGWTWNKNLFPDYRKFLQYIKEQDLQVTINLHPADGIAPYEVQYPAVAKDLGIDPATKQTIPWVVSDKKFMQAVFKDILHPMQREGIDFWWLDWQQWPYDKQVDSLSNTWWINYCFFTDRERNGNERPMLYHRWGGLGNHRYQVGFSGDSYISWNSLAFQPYFNSTASNVLYGYWSHDIGGHMGGKIIPEMYVRWLQFGAVAPIMRTHSTKAADLNKEPWAFDKQYMNVIAQTIRERYTLVPYIYTMARRAYDEGVSLCRPLYYDYPEASEAYNFKNEYLFGDNLLIAPVTAPMSNGRATLKVWLPAGNDWYEWHTGTLLKGGQTIERTFALDEYPIYIKAGSILPFYGKEVKNLRHTDEAVVVTVFPGREGAFTLYEDNGNDKDYAAHYATTPLRYTWKDNVLRVTIGARKGSYPDMPEKRDFTVKVEASAVPSLVTLDGQAIPFTYDGEALALSIPVAGKACSEKKVLEVTYSADRPVLTDGLKGKFRHLRQAVVDLKTNVPNQAGIQITERLGFLESAGRQLSYHPEALNTTVARFEKEYNELPDVLKEQKLNEQDAAHFLQVAGWESEK